MSAHKKGMEHKRGGYYSGPTISLYGSSGKPDPLPNAGSWWATPGITREEFDRIVRERSAHYKGPVDAIYAPDKFHGSK